MTTKTAIFELADQYALLGACEGDNEFIPIWLMMNCGMHPADVAAAGRKVTWNGPFIMWKRVKNSAARKEMIPESIRPRLEGWLKKGRKLTREGYNRLVHRVGERTGHPEYSPLTLRKTFGINEFRRFAEMDKPPPEMIRLVARKMGCTENTAMDYYLDWEQWERLGKEREEHGDQGVYGRLQQGGND